MNKEDIQDANSAAENPNNDTEEGPEPGFPDEEGISNRPDASYRENPLTKKRLLLLSLGALGIVYGDIGTSPLYALRECFHGNNAVYPSDNNVLGVLSLIFWSLILIISIKYLLLVMRADNDGEGGILALMALQ